MIERVIISKGSYHDSAFLMRLSREISELSGVAEAVVLMGTEMNRQLLADAGFKDPELEQATPMDLVTAIRAEAQENFQAAQQDLARLLKVAAAGVGANQSERIYDNLAAAMQAQADINLVSIAVPGQYAVYLSDQALDAGKHVFLFSNNVAIEDELRLKQRARELGLLLMGPDCGTAWLAGVGLGFANRVRRGPIGLVGASGTGMQEIACRLHSQGLGISQGIGTGSADLSAQVGGIMTEAGIELLANDDQTQVIVLVAKHPAPAVADRLHQILTAIDKPVVVRYLGQSPRVSVAGLSYAADLDQAASLAAAFVRKKKYQQPDITPLAMLGTEAKTPGRLIGLFGGGSLAAEAAMLLGEAGLEIEVPDHPLAFDGGVEGSAHLVIDAGADFYTVGKPHPMIDQTLRCQMIRAVFADPKVSLLLLDLVLGDGAHPDPAPELTETIFQARQQRGLHPLLVIASVSGTDLDPQDLKRQILLLTSAGVQVPASSARAAKLAAAVMTKGAGHVA